MLVCTTIESDYSLDLSQYLEKQKLRYQNQQGIEKYKKEKKMVDTMLCYSNQKNWSLWWYTFHNLCSFGSIVRNE